MEPIDKSIQESIELISVNSGNNDGFGFDKFVFEMSEIIEDLLVRHPDTVGAYYNKLVVQEKIVSKRDFWMRYFCKCDPKTIERFLSSHSLSSSSSSKLSMKKKRFFHRSRSTLRDDDWSQSSSSLSPSSSTFSMNSLVSGIKKQPSRRKSTSSVKKGNSFKILSSKKKKNSIKNLFKKKSSPLTFDQDVGNDCNNDNDYHQSQNEDNNSNKKNPDICNFFDGPELDAVSEYNRTENTDEESEDATTLEESDKDEEKGGEDMEFNKEVAVQIEEKSIEITVVFQEENHDNENRKMENSKFKTETKDIVTANLKESSKGFDTRTETETATRVKESNKKREGAEEDNANKEAAIRVDVESNEEEMVYEKLENGVKWSIQVIQRNARMYQTVREYQMILKSIKKLQRCYRDYQVRRYNDIKMIGALTIQRVYRGYDCRNTCFHLKTSIVRIQSYYKMYFSVKQYEKTKRSIQAIQGNVRVRQTVREYQTKLISIRSLQRYYRGYQVIRCNSMKLIGAIAIQRVYRGYYFRNICSNLKTSVVRIQSYCKMVLSVKRFKKMNKLIQMIQCNMRMHQTAREYQTTLKSVRNLQKYYRDYQKRRYTAQLRHNSELLIEFEDKINMMLAFSY